MRLERRAGNTGRMIEVERAHEELTGKFQPYHEIAAELYDRLGTQAKVRDEIERRYKAPIAEKTASLWINRGLEERKKKEAAPAA